MNCWEFKKCGREAGGANSEKEGVCPAYPDSGNKCARVTGTLCNGEVQGTFATKLGNCLKCDFYKSEHYGRLYEDAANEEKEPLTSRRKEERIVAFKPINIFGIDSLYSAYSINYSSCGLGMITTVDCAPGDKMKVSCSEFWDSPKEAVVVWTSSVNNESRKVGLSLC